MNSAIARAEIAMSIWRLPPEGEIAALAMD
jgi:hypothetical protein